jgi:hypothetical protein
MERLNGLSDGRDSTMLCISLSSWDWDGYLISLATGAMRCRILIRVSSMRLLAVVYWQPREWSMYGSTFRLQVQM